jgi:menaquinone-9 beta-reductase
MSQTTNQKSFQIIIIGGGLAGLTAGIHLSKIGFEVLIIEKNKYPKHKVCGEYISNEVLNYFNYLDIDIQALKPSTVNTLTFSVPSGKTISSKLPLGGFGISRFALDFYLFEKAKQSGCVFVHDTIEEVVFNDNKFSIKSTTNNNFESKIVLGAFGKRSNIDKSLNRKFITQNSPWLGVKAHYEAKISENVVGLHTFLGGYCGISKIENDLVNVCYLSDYKSFKNYKNIDEYQKKVMEQNPNLKQFFESATMVFEKPLTISQISFQKKQAVENHILMIGDTAGLINPLCGNGMAMAIHSAKIISDLLQNQDCETLNNRQKLEIAYQKQWNFHFKKRIKAGQILAKLLQKPKLSQILLRIFVLFPTLLQQIVKQTHGKPF